MAPEHLRALAYRDPALVRQVDQRADLYSLGMVLYEMLTGTRPFDQSGSYSPMPALIEAMAVERAHKAPSLRAQRQDVPWSLESIARKCLCPDPSKRYQRAEHLAEDLRRFLEDRPLQHAPELSYAERATKWARRHPRLASTGALTLVAGVLLLAAAGIVASLRDQLRTAWSSLDKAEGAEARETQRAFLDDANRARCLVNSTTETTDYLSEGLTACEATLGHYAILERDDWQQHPAWQRLEPHDQRLLAEEIREVLLLLAQAHVLKISRDKTPDSGAVLRGALSLLDKAEAIGGLETTRAIWEDRASYLDKLGEKAEAAAARARAGRLRPVTARDHCLLAASYARANQPAPALEELNQALRLNPRHYWAWFQRGQCHSALGDYVLAVRDFSDCTTLWPEFPWAYFNRACVLNQLGKNQEAIEDYTTALTLDGGFALAYGNRGRVYLDLQQPLRALQDFDSALERGPGDVYLHTGRGLALAQLNRPEEADAAFAKARAQGPTNPVFLLGYGFAVYKRLPGQAREAFLQLLKQDPSNLRGLYGCAMLAAEEARNSAEALDYFSRALAVDPLFWVARRGRANVLAHRGDWKQACEDIDQCVKAEPNGVTLYAAACVYALLAKNSSDRRIAPAAAQRALDLLREAFLQGYGVENAAQDEDLAFLHRDPRFLDLVERMRKGKTDT
jgi:tetratricopeptide (TPR) repeat protein